MYCEIFLKGEIPYNELSNNNELKTFMSNLHECDVRIINHRYTNYNTTMVALELTFESPSIKDIDWLEELEEATTIR